MTYQEIYAKVKDALKNADGSVISGKLAIEFDITGEGEGKFYVLVDEGKIFVEPYDYVDNDARLIADANTLIKVASGRVKAETAYATGALKIEGNVGRALEFKEIIKSAAPAKKPRRTKEQVAADKAAKEAAKAEKEAEKAAKTAEKAEKATAAKVAEKAEKKAPATKKTAAKKPAAKKAGK